MTKVTCPVKPIEPKKPTPASIKEEEDVFTFVLDEKIFTKEELLKEIESLVDNIKAIPSSQITLGFDRIFYENDSEDEDNHYPEEALEINFYYKKKVSSELKLEESKKFALELAEYHRKYAQYILDMNDYENNLNEYNLWLENIKNKYNIKDTDFSEKLLLKAINHLQNYLDENPNPSENVIARIISAYKDK